MKQSEVYEIEIEATDVVPFVWLDVNMTRISKFKKDFLYHFSDNAFYITEPTTKVQLHLYNPPEEIDIKLEDITICWIYNC